MTDKEENPKGIDQRARRIVRDLRQGEPGQRFMRYWRLRKDREREHLARKLAVLGLGFLLVIAGIILGPTPIAPGFLLFLPGLAILASRLRFVARTLDRAEIILRRLAAKFRGGQKRGA
jgi:peptidoglycan/LPS O-acetylase OafA/YrhL